MEESVLHPTLSKRVLGSLQLICIWSRGQTPSSKLEGHEARGQCQLQAQRKAISYCKPLLHKLGTSFTNLGLSVAECVHTCVFLFQASIFAFVLLTNFLANGSSLPHQLTPLSETESCRQDKGYGQRGAS